MSVTCHLIPVTLLLLLSGCDWMGRQANAVGEYMPVIGERCENWQCVTSEGQARSDAIKAQEQRQSQPQPQPQAEPTPIYPPDAVPQTQARKPFNPPDAARPASPEQHLITEPPI